MANREFTVVRTASWILYDLANTVYAATVAYLFVPAFVRDGNEVRLGVVTTGAMLLAGLLVPILGAICDRTGRARSCLAFATVVCVAAMSQLSVAPHQEWRTLMFLSVAHVAFQSALVCYNALLPSVASVARSGLVSGIGTGVGYLGTILTLAVLVPVLTARGLDCDAVIDAAALLFLLAALPCLLMVRDRRFERARPMTVLAARASLTSLVRTIRRLPEQRPLMLFLLGNFCLLDVLNTAVIYFGFVAKDGFTDLLAAGELSLFGHPFATIQGFVGAVGLILNALALVFGVFLGYVTDRYSAIGTMRVAGWVLVIGIVGGACTVGRSVEGFLSTMVLCGAFGLAGLFTAGRKVVVELAPVARRGEFFGLYGMTAKLSVVGNLTFMMVHAAAGLTVALLSQLVAAVAGLMFLHAVRMPEAEPIPIETGTEVLS